MVAHLVGSLSLRHSANSMSLLKKAVRGKTPFIPVAYISLIKELDSTEYGREDECS